ncbi:MAG: hypothetical protein JRI38_04805 [Deltaproteobacteria bacterium]|nr:hypothetical protein [Deltaproteobacteria bacterium]
MIEKYACGDRQLDKIFENVTLNACACQGVNSGIRINQEKKKMQQKDFYSNAHLVVAAIRIIEHQKSTEPTVDAICRFLSFSPEQGNFICRQLRKMGILNNIESAFGIRLFIKDHLKLEEISRGEQDSRLEKELANFQSNREDMDKKVKSFQSEQAQKQKDLFAELEKKLKTGLEKK